MPTYTFNRGMADSVRDQMAAVTNKLISELNELTQAVNSSLQEWQDAARQQFDVAKAQWDNAAARMPTHLGSAEVTLANITDGYLKVEHTGVNAWGGYSMT